MITVGSCELLKKRTLTSSINNATCKIYIY